MDNAPWFLHVLDGGRVDPLPVFSDGLTIRAEEIGAMEFRSGRARVAPDDEWSEARPPIDRPVATGHWRVRRLLAAEQHVTGDNANGELGPVASVLVHHVADLAELDWQLATSGGRPIQTLQDRVIIADAEVGLTFGSVAPGVSLGFNDRYTHSSPYPQSLASDGSIVRLSEDSLPIYSTPRNQQFSVPPWVFLGMEETWIGMDGDCVRAIVHDVLSPYLRGVAAPRAEDVWTDPVGAIGGQLNHDVRRLTESADVTRFLRENPDEFWFLGVMEVDGGLGLFPARRARWPRPAIPDFAAITHPFPFAFSGPARVYASWHGQAEGQLLVRLGDAAPTTWIWLEEPGFLDANGGELMLASLADVSADAADDVSALLSDVTAWPNSCINRSRDGRLRAAHWYVLGDEPGFWLAGLDEGNNVTAVYAGLDADTTIFTARPAALDAPLLTAMQASPDLDDDDMENLQRFTSGLSDHGELSPLDRGLLHWTANKLGISVLD